MNDAAPFRLAADSASRQRARGEARVRFARAGARSAAERAFETGGLRLRFPRSDAECEAVLVNTGGGMAGGDRATIAVEVGAYARALVTTQSAEKIYRCEGEPARVATRLRSSPAARSSGRLRRRCCSRTLRWSGGSTPSLPPTRRC